MWYFCQKLEFTSNKIANDLYLPTGVPNHTFSFHENYGESNDGFKVSVDLLREVTEVSEVLQKNQDILDVFLSTRLWDLTPYPEQLKPNKTVNAFFFFFFLKIPFLVGNLGYHFLPNWKSPKFPKLSTNKFT